MITIVDYGMGNLKSVVNALKQLDIPCKISQGLEDLREAKALIIPGVGSYKDAMDNLESLGYVKVIKEKVAEGTSILGICLGMQMFFEASYEVEKKVGFGFFSGEVRLIQPKQKVKIPHIGWNRLEIRNGSSFKDILGNDSFVYFVHSYCAQNINNDEMVAYSEYGGCKIPAIMLKDNVMGVQFHPEKSGEVGLKILKEFGEWVI